MNLIKFSYAFIYSQFIELFIPSAIKKVEKSAFENMAFLEKIDLSLLIIISLFRYTYHKCFLLYNASILQTINKIILSLIKVKNIFLYISIIMPLHYLLI